MVSSGGIGTRRTFMASLAAASSALLTGCSPLVLINQLVPSRSYEVTKDVAYGKGPRRRMDIYRPAGDAVAEVAGVGKVAKVTQAGKEGLPVVVFFYGGNWNSGSKDDYLVRRRGAGLARFCHRHSGLSAVSRSALPGFSG